MLPQQQQQHVKQLLQSRLNHIRHLEHYERRLEDAIDSIQTTKTDLHHLIGLTTEIIHLQLVQQPPQQEPQQHPYTHLPRTPQREAPAEVIQPCEQKSSSEMREKQGLFATLTSLLASMSPVIVCVMDELSDDNNADTIANKQS